MKSTEPKTSHSQLPSTRKTAHPFFRKDGQGAFFAKETPQLDYFFKPKSIQPKLTINQPNDPYEQEADRMAEKVVGSNLGQVTAAPPPVQRQGAACGQEEELQTKMSLGMQQKPIFESEANPNSDLQMKCAACEAEEQEGMVQGKQMTPSGEGSASSSLESTLTASKGSGAPLPDDTRSQMESSFGADFSGVRVHTGGRAVQMNRELNAQAFTHGNDIYFNAGKYDTGSTEGKRLLGHELTHTIQQSTPKIQKFGFGEHMELGNEATKGPQGQTGMVQLADDYFVPFGQVVAMAGDHFESIEQMKKFANNNGRGPGTREEIEYVRYEKIQKSKDKTKGIDLTKTHFSKEAMESADKRYYELALQNRSHFLNPTEKDLTKTIDEKGDDLIKKWQIEGSIFSGFNFKSVLVPQNGNAAYRLNHFQAILEAYMAGQNGESIDGAMATEAFGNHYLTDAFSSGHVTTPRADILAHWNDLVPMFNHNLKGYMAEKIAYKFNEISLKGWVSSVDLIYDTDGWSWLPGVPAKGTHATVSDLIDAKGTLTLGDVVSGALHDYYNERGMLVYIDGEKRRVMGDGYLNGKKDAAGNVVVENESRKYITDAIRSSIQDIQLAWEAGSKQEIPVAPFSSLIMEGVFKAEKLIPVPIPDLELSEEEKSVNWKFNSYTELLENTKFKTALKVFVDSQASEFQAAADELDDADKKMAFEKAIIERMKDNPANVIKEIIEWSPDTGGGFLGHNTDDNALDYSEKMEKGGFLDKLNTAQRIRLVKQLASGIWAAGDEEEMIVKLFETAPASERLIMYKTIEGHEWNGDFVQGWRVPDDDLWNAIDDDDRLSRLRKAINQGYVIRP